MLLRGNNMEDNFSPTAIGQRIKKARLSAGLTQYQLYEITGIATSQISAYENGSRNIGLDTLYKIAKAANKTIDEIYVGSKANAPINKAESKGELIVNCVYALYKNKVIQRLVHEKNDYVYDGYEIYYKIGFADYVHILDDMIDKLDDLEENKSNYPNPSEVEKQILSMIAKRINDSNTKNIKKKLIKDL